MKTPLRAALLPILVLIVGIPASFLVYFALKNSVARLGQLQFDQLATAMNSVLENRLHSYSHVLYALRAQFAANKSVDRASFHRFTNSLDIQRRYPGFVSLNYAAHVLAQDKAAFEAAVRGDKGIKPEGYPNFAIKPPGERPEYFVLTYLEPMEGYEFAFGLDLSSNPMAKDPERVAAAVRMHRDTGRLSASAQPLRVKQGKEVIYLAMRLAIYKPGAPTASLSERRAAYVGSVGAAFDIEGLVQAALATQKVSQIRCKLYDLGLISTGVKSSAPSERRLLIDTQNFYTSDSQENVDSNKSLIYVFRERVEIADRIWEFEYSAPQDAILSGIDKWLAPMALGAGLLTTFLLFGIVYTLANSRRRAMAIAADITRDLRDSEQGMVQAQRMAHLGNWALEPATWHMTWSDETYRIFGLDPATMPQTYAEYLQRIYGEDREAVDRTLRHALEANEDVSFEHRIVVLPDASVRWVLTSARPTTRNRLGQMPGIMMDITERKQVEAELKQSHEQLQYLSWQLVEAQETERRRIATELHDVVGQNLTALSINLHIVKDQAAPLKNAAMEGRIADSANLLQSTTQAIEGVMSDLRPPMLDDYGLPPALQWYAAQYSERTGIKVKMAGEEVMPRLTPAAELALFRVVQEALNNVAKHAQASNVEIQVERDESQVILSVTDDGKGMQPPRPIPARRRPGLGMITMRERIQTFGGTVVVQKAAGGGTRVEFRIPF